MIAVMTLIVWWIIPNAWWIPFTLYIGGYVLLMIGFLITAIVRQRFKKKYKGWEIPEK